MCIRDRDDTFKNLDYDKNNEYSVPYTFGYVGIIYNKKYITKTVDSWNALWDPEYSGKVLMFDNPRDAFGIAQFLLGKDINTENKPDYYECYKKLLEQKPLVQSYVMDQIFEQMENEEAWIAPYYAGDFLTMQDSNENLEFAFPKEGYNYFVAVSYTHLDVYKRQYISKNCVAKADEFSLEKFGANVLKVYYQAIAHNSRVLERKFLKKQNKIDFLRIMKNEKFKNR